MSQADAQSLQTQTADYLEGLLEGFVAYDQHWRMTYMNASAERILGRRREEVVGKTWHDAFPHAPGNAVDEMYKRVMATRSAETMEYYYPHYGMWMEISASPVRAGGVAVYFRDISQRKRAEEALREETRTHEVLDRVGKTLAAELDLERVVQAVTDAGTELSGAAFGSFFYNVRNAAGESYLLYTISGVPREEFSKFPMPRKTAVFGPTFAGEGIVRVDDITRDPRYGRNAPHRGMPAGHLPVRSYLAVPVVSRSGEVIGGLFFGHPDAGVFTGRAERIVAGIAAQAAIAIDNARLYRDLQRSRDELGAQVDSLTRLHELAVELGGLRDLDHILRMALETVVRLNGTTRGLLQLYDPSFGGLAVAASLGLDQQTLTRVARLMPGARSGAAGAALAQKKRVVVEDTEADPRYESLRDVARATGYRAVHSTPILNRAGEILGVVSVHFESPCRPGQTQMQLTDMCVRYVADVIESARYQDTLRAQGEELKLADRRKDEFLATLAHELRNPLAPIRNGLHLLRIADPASEAATQARAMMERQMTHLVRLVDDLLEVSRITTGKLELRQEPVELAAVIGSAIETSRPLIDARGHDLQIELPAEALHLRGDPVRLAQVVANLLNNAARYTESGAEGGGRIRLAVRREHGSAVISVKDNGMGISPVMLPRIFDMFAQAGSHATRMHGGLGIGLTLARRLVDLHGGSIEALSEGTGKGSEFIVRLPLASWKATAAARKAIASAQAETAAPPRRVLIVDDNIDAAQSLALLLRQMGHQVRLAHDGWAALETARADHPEVMLLDLSMPGLDGLGVATLLRQDPSFASTRIIAITGHGQEEDRSRSREAGIDEHLVKPVAPEKLQSLLQ